jgi:hypothetical protein
MPTQYTQTSSIPLSVAVFLATDHYDHNDDPFTLSATTIIKTVRQIILGARAKTDDVQIELMSMMASREGTALHSAIELAWTDKELRDSALKALGYPQRVIDKVKVNPTPEELAADEDIIPVYMEQRWSRQVGKWTITGKVDFVGQGQLEDFKRASSYVVTTHINDDKFKWQGSVYRWLRPDLITEPNLHIQFFISDWSSMMAKQDPTYPQQRHLKRVIPLVPLVETTAMIHNKVADLEKFWDANESDIPECTMDELQLSDPKFKYYKSGDINALRSTKNFDSMEDAMMHMHGKEGGKGAIKEVPGQVTACRFCDAFSLCSQKDRLVKAGLLTL